MMIYNHATGWVLLFYALVFLFAIIIRLIFAWLISDRAYMIADYKGYEKSELKIDRLAIFLALFFGIIICYLITLLFVHALPERRMP